MKTLLTILTVFFTVMFSPPSYAEWTKVTENVMMNGYVDLERIRKVDGFVYWWSLQDRFKRDQYGNLSAKIYYQGDCKLFRFKNVTLSFHKEPMGRGIGETITPPKTNSWLYPAPNTSGEASLNAVCDR